MSRMLKLLGRLFLSLLLLALGAAAAVHFASTKSSRPAPVHSTGLTIEQVQQLADLVVLKVEVSDVMECRIDGWTGGVQGALIVQGDVQLATDLSQARFVSMNPAEHTATLLLSPPKVAHPRVNHDGTRLYSVSTHGLWSLVPEDKAYRAVLNQLYAQAQDSMARAGGSPELRDRARAHAQRVLEWFFISLGWQVTIRWSDRP